MQYSELLALDIGKTRVGVARANTVARIAEPLTTLNNDDLLMDNIWDLVRQYNAEAIVVGLPRGLDFQDTQQTKYTRAVADKIADTTKLPVLLSDEALSSVDAKKRLSETKKQYQKAEVDAVAAAVILDNFMSIEMSKR